MTQWLQAAKLGEVLVTELTKPTEPPPGAPSAVVLSVKSVLSGHAQRDSAAVKAVISADGLHPDDCALLDFLHREGPHTYGAAATALGWGATRAWQTVARLGAAGLLQYGMHGRAHPTAKGSGHEPK